MNKFLKRIFLLSVACCLLFVFSANIGLAADCKSKNTEEQGSIWSLIQECRDCGECALDDFARVAVNISTWILGIVGSIALLFFIYGGVIFLISGGSSEKVAQAKQIIVGAVIGIALVFASYMIINFVAQALGIVAPGQSILRTDWFNK